MKKFLFSSFRNNLTIIIGLGFFSMFSSVFSLVLPYFNGVFLDVILKKPDIKIIYNFALVLFLFGIISCIVNFFYSMSMTKVKNTIIYNVWDDFSVWPRPACARFFIPPEKRSR